MDWLRRQLDREQRRDERPDPLAKPRLRVVIGERSVNKVTKTKDPVVWRLEALRNEVYPGDSNRWVVLVSEKTGKHKTVSKDEYKLSYEPAPFREPTKRSRIAELSAAVLTVLASLDEECIETCYSAELLGDPHTVLYQLSTCGPMELARLNITDGKESCDLDKAVFALREEMAR